MRRVLGCLMAAPLLAGACSSPTPSEPVTIDVTIGKVSPTDAQYDVSKGSTVTINAASD